MAEPETFADLARTPAERGASAVPLIGIAVWGAAEIMHWAAWPGMTAEAALGAVAAFGVAFGLSAHRGWGWKVPLLTAALSAWIVLASASGPLSGFPVPSLTAVWAVLTAVAWRLALGHPLITEARRWRTLRADWLVTRHRWRLAGSHLLEHEETRLGERLVVDVSETGTLASAIARAGSSLAERIAMDRGIPKSRVTVAEGSPAGRIVIEIRDKDPWAKPIPHPALDPEHEVALDYPCSVRVPLEVGQDPATGTVIRIPLWDEAGAKNVNVVGMKGAGKDVLLNNLSERVTAARDGLLIRMDISVKGLGLAGTWGPACHLTACGTEQAARALRILQAVGRIIEWRARQPRTTSVLIPTEQDPLVVLMINEIDALTRIPALRRELANIATKGRELGVAVVRAGQRGTADWTGGSDVRSQDDVFCIGMVNRSTEAMHAAGDLGLELPDMARYGEGHSGVWVIARLGSKEWHAGRTWKLSEPPDLAEIALERAPYQPDLPEACKEFLGDEYAVLVGSDLYARQVNRGITPVTPVPAPPPQDAPGAQEAGGAATVAVIASEDPITRLDFAMDEETAARFRAVDEKIARAKRIFAETDALPKPPEVDPEKLRASSAERWRQVGEQAEIAPEAMESLLRLLAEGTTIGQVAEVLGVTRWIARTYLEKLRGQGAARVVGERKAARWRLTEGDSQ